MARDEKILVRISEIKKDELQLLADRWGIPLSSLCAVVLGQWVDQQLRILSAVEESAQKVLHAELDKARAQYEAGEPEINKQVERSLADLLSKLMTSKGA